jgi:hypothetical protein
MFNRGDAIYNAKSQRLEKRYSLLRLPRLGWIFGNLHWLLIFGVSVFGCVWLTRRALGSGASKEANV